MPRVKVELRAGGLLFSGWTSVSMTSSLENGAAGFELSLARAQFAEVPRPIPEGAPCQLLADGEVILSGYVDRFSASYDGPTLNVGVTGRSKTCDLIDCSVKHDTGTFRNRSLLQLAEELCEPFGIDVRNRVDPSTDPERTVSRPFPVFEIESCEKVFDAIKRAAAMRGVLLFASPEGTLEITRAGITRAADQLIAGENVAGGSYEGDHGDRYSHYTCRSQGKGSDNSFGKAAAILKASCEDNEVKRYRPFVFEAEAMGDGISLQDRVNLERNIRRGRSRHITQSAQGWRQSDGTLWRPNQITRVRDRILGVDEDLLIVSVTRTQSSDQGTLCQMEVAPPEAFGVLPPKEKKRETGKELKADFFP